jgi:hypothetical protein
VNFPLPPADATVTATCTRFAGELQLLGCFQLLCCCYEREAFIEVAQQPKTETPRTHAPPAAGRQAPASRGGTATVHWKEESKEGSVQRAGPRRGEVWPISRLLETTEGSGERGTRVWFSLGCSMWFMEHQIWASRDWVVRTISAKQAESKAEGECSRLDRMVGGG